MTAKNPERHYESAHEEFARKIKELYQLADKIGLRLKITVRKKSDAPAVPAQPKTQPFANPTQGKREPGEN